MNRSARTPSVTLPRTVLALALLAPATRPQTDAADPGRPVIAARTVRQDDELANALDRLVAEALRDGARGLVVAIDVGGAALFARGWGTDARAGAGTAIHVAPLLPTFLSVAALRLAAEEELDLDAALSSLLPELAAEGVRVDQLLTHTSGLPDYGEHLGVEVPRAEPAEILAWLAKEPPDAAPGTCTAYSPTNDLLLGLVLERRNDAELAELLREIVFAPAGMEDTGWSCEPPPRGPVSAQELAGALEERPAAPLPFDAEELCSTAADLVRFQRALAGGALLAESARELRAEPVRLADGKRVGQGRGISLTELEDLPRHSAGGSFAGEHVHLTYYPTLDATLVVAASGDDVGLLQLEARIARLAFGLEAPERVDLAVPAELRARCVGEYFAGCTPHVVLAEAEHLVLRRPEGRRSVLLLQADGTFVAREDPDVHVAFETERERVVALVLRERGVRLEARRLY
jgi:CubicO group peptidase (beta-lactamase class C family)